MGTYPAEGKGYPLQHSGLENSMDCIVHGITKSWTGLSDFCFACKVRICAILIAKFRLKLKKVGKTTRPFRYDLNQIPFDYTVEVINKLKGLDLIDRVPDELWNEVPDIVQETGIKTIPMEKKCKKAKWLLGGLTYSCEKKRSKKQRRKGKI